MRRLTTLSLVLVTLAASLTAASLPATADAQAAWATRIARGRTLLDQGRFAEARAEYAALVQNVAAMSGDQAAAAYFGRGAATQQLLRAGDSLSAGAADSALADYEWALRLDGAAYGRVAAYNAALLQRLLGRHAAAAASFERAAAADSGASRARVLLRAAREAETGADTAAAQRLYRAALAADPGGVDARLALVRLPGAMPLDSVLRVLTPLVRDTAHAAAVADAAVAALAARVGRSELATREADSLLALAAAANVAAATSPELFARTQRDALLPVARSGVRLATGAAMLRDVFAGRAPAPRSPPPAWWGTSWERRGVWSGVLRTIGEWHDREDRDSLAVAYYRAALGLPGEMEPWVDLGAVLPLLTIHDRRGETRESARLLDAAFAGKSLAYQEQNVARIRAFHMALGAYFANKGQWAGSPRGAIFQLERMRQMTRRLPEARRPIDPPFLLEQLIEGYVATRRLDDARSLLPDLRAANAQAGLADTSGRWATRIERQRDVR